MKINKPELIDEDQLIKMRSLVEFQEKKQYLWYSVERHYADYLTVERLDAFLVGLIIYAMKINEDIYIDGPISEKLFYNLTNYYMKILTSVIPSLHRIEIVPKELDNGRLCQTKSGVATGFSGGIDSFCVLADHLYGEVPEGYKITHLIFNNVGSHGHGRGGRRLFIDRYQRILPFAEELQIPIIRIDSNLDELFKMSFLQTHTPRNVSAVLILQKLLGKYLYASGYRYEDCFGGGAYGIAAADPVAVYLLSTETMDCISTGYQYSRVEKIMRVAEIEPSYRYLDVCVNPDGAGNCSTCWKCARTLLTLEIIGKLQLYDKVFCLDKYPRIRRSYIAKVLSSKYPLLKEIVNLAAERNYRFPLLSKAGGTFLKMYELLQGLIPSCILRIVKRLIDSLKV